jgi:hypothetical protein
MTTVHSAGAVDRMLAGDTQLPAPIEPTALV